MTSPARASISAFPRGYEFPVTTFTVSAGGVRAYLDAVGDEHAYGGTVPPLALVAMALSALQQWISLPEGSLHTGQEVEHSAAVSAGEPARVTGRIVQRSERQGFVISVIELDIASNAGLAVRARATIMAPIGTG